LPLGQKSSLARLVAAGFLLPYSDGNKLALAAQELALAVPSDFGFTIMATEPSLDFTIQTVTLQIANKSLAEKFQLSHGSPSILTHGSLDLAD
jgi:hypothetical protein